MQDARVPAANLLGDVGRGHKIAFNTLNYGRLKLGAMCSGGARLAIEEAARYAGQRKQFGKPIASFGAIKQKLGDMTARQYAVEAMLYRTAGMIDATLAPGHAPAQILATLEEFAVEASILKVAASEAVDFILDENVQSHGGNGFVSDYPAERHYRDARVNRIFEGTNEINRLLIPGMLARRAVKGDLPLIPAAKRLMDDVMAPPSLDPESEGPLDAERRAVAAMKKVALMVLGSAMDKYRDTLADEQEVLLATADILIDTYASESAVFRASHGGGAPLHEAAARVYVHDAAARIEAVGKDGARGDGRRHAADAPGRAAPAAEEWRRSIRSRCAGSWRTRRSSGARICSEPNLTRLATTLVTAMTFSGRRRTIGPLPRWKVEAGRDSRSGGTHLAPNKRTRAAPP